MKHAYKKSAEAIPDKPVGFRCWHGHTGFGCGQVVEMAKWNFPCLLCADCADKVAKAVGCRYDYASLALTCKRHDKWYRERYPAILGPLSEKARVRVMMLMADKESLHEVTEHERKVSHELATENGWGTRKLDVGTVPA